MTKSSGTILDADRRPEGRGAATEPSNQRAAHAQPLPGAAGAEGLVDLVPGDLWRIPAAEIATLQLRALNERFTRLAPRIPVVSKLAAEQGIERLTDLEAAAPLLLRHSVYKSYPLSFLENGEFQRLTRWLDGLTAYDLSQVDASGCQSIDEWIALLDRSTEIRLIHSSGTSGKLSFLPRSEGEFATLHLKWQQHFFEGFGEEGEHRIEGIKDMPLITPSHRYGALGQHRMIEHIAKFWHRGRDTPILALHPTRMSADALSLGGRLQAAEARGELGRLQLSPRLLERREEFLREAREAPQRMAAFLDAVAPYRGGRVLMLGLQLQYYDFAVAGKARGMSQVFAPDSLISMGGGTKNRTLPADWQATMFDFLGRTVRDAYGMSEIMGGTRRCLHGHYHLQPWIVLYLLDPRSGRVLPREGTQTGRLGVFDLLAATYWGGFLSGDEVTITFDEALRCPCGRVGPYVHGALRRYSAQEGGDDKITCAGAPEAHDSAVRYLIDLAG